MPYYRIDNRRFNIGEIIPPQAEFVLRASKERLLIEKTLFQTKPKPDRNTILKVFGNCNDAMKFWILSPNSIFYEVRINENNISHRGDYSLIQQISASKEDETKIALAKRYWNDTNDESTIIEYFIDQAEVIRIISNNEKERENTRSAHYKMDTIPGIRVINCE